MPSPVTGADRHRALVAMHQFLGNLGRDVGLVEHEQLGHVSASISAEHLANRGDLALGIGRGAVDDVHQVVGRDRRPRACS